MGLPIKHRKKFISHKKKWDKNTILQEAVLVKDYGLKNKKEIKKVELKLSKIKDLAKEFNKSTQTKESAEAKHFIEKLKAQGFLNAQATSLDEVLDITIRDLLERRLSTIIYQKKLARTPFQARQFIVHRHVKVAGKVIDSPAHLVPLADEFTIEFVESSALANEEHPERKLLVEEILAEKEEFSKISKKEIEMDSESVVEDEEAEEVAE